MTTTAPRPAEPFDADLEAVLVELDEFTSMVSRQHPTADRERLRLGAPDVERRLTTAENLVGLALFSRDVTRIRTDFAELQAAWHAASAWLEVQP